MVALSGKISPSLARYLSRAYKTVSSMLSYKRKYPIHSEMMMSTFGKGSSISSIFPWISVILSDIPLTLTISRALKMMVDMSTPMTCFAPALTANLSCRVRQLPCMRKGHSGAAHTLRELRYRILHQEPPCP